MVSLDYLIGTSQLSHVQAAEEMAEELLQLLDAAKTELKTTQARQKRCFDSQHHDLPFQVGQNLLLSTKHLALSGSCKLSCKWIGFICIAQWIGLVAYKLTLPQALVGLHPVFHISRLKPYVQGGGDGMDLGAGLGPLMV